MIMSWVIYKHTNKKTKQVYIGQTKQKPEERWQGGKGYHKNTYFRNAIEKYGWDGFTHEIIAENISTQDEANELEKYYIEKYDSFNNGYNLTKGGHDGDHLGFEVVQIEKQSLRPLRVFKSIRAASDETHINHSNISAAALRQTVSAGGFYWSYADEYDENTWFPLANNNFSPVIAIDMVFLKKVDEFSSAKEAGIAYDINPSHIIAVCRNRLSSAGGYYWCYKKDYNDDYKPKTLSFRRIIDTTTGKIYINSLTASRELKILNSSIYRCLSGELVSAGGRVFRYIDENGNIRNIERFDERPKKVCVFETKEVFESLTEAAKHFNCTKENILRCLKNPSNTVQSLHFCYFDELAKFTPVTKKDKLPVYCVELNRSFPSATVASITLNIDLSQICKCCKNYRLTAGGYHWCYLNDKNTFRILPKIQNKGSSKKIRCTETNLEFKSIKSASIATGIKSSQICACLKKRQHTAGGYHWNYVKK